MGWWSISTFDEGIARIEGFAKQMGIVWGICDAVEIPIEGLLRESDTPFVSKDTGLRVAPGRVMPGCQSIVVVGVGYGMRVEEPQDDTPRGIQTVLCASSDYHGRVRGILEALAQALVEIRPGLNYLVQVDTGPLVERELALRAGIGFFGRSHQLISGRFGTYFNIGLLLLDVPLSPSVPEPRNYDRCGSCRACIRACPGGALAEGRLLNWRRCASYLTQKKGELDPEEQAIVGRHIYGCDTCQLVCPYNIKPSRTFPVVEDIESVRPSLYAVANMDKAAFKLRYRDSVAAWRGPAVLRRNANIAMQHLQREGV